MQYWEEKFNLMEYDWENCFSNVLFSKLLPRKIHDFNFKIIYGVLPTEKRLNKMKLSDGICKICDNEIENSEHLFFNCKKLENIWILLENMINKSNEDKIKFDYKTIILGTGIDYEITKDIINMLIFMLKWNIWKRRNLYVFEYEFQSVNYIWRSFCNDAKIHCEVLKKINPIMQTAMQKHK